MKDPIMEKYVEQFAKILSQSSIMAFSKLPNICEHYMSRLMKFYDILGKYKSKKVTDQKKCLNIVKKIEKSVVYTDLLENCLVHKFNEITKIYKNYPKQISKMIAITKKIGKLLTKKLKELKKNGNKEKMMFMIAKENIKKIDESIEKMEEENKKFTSFFKKNKKALDELKKDKKKYITFFAVRYPLGCFVLP